METIFSFMLDNLALHNRAQWRMVFPRGHFVKPSISKIAGDCWRELIQDPAEVLQSDCIQERPDGWKVANLMSLFKIGSGNTSGNYRPFSFDSFVPGMKVLKSILGD